MVLVEDPFRLDDIEVLVAPCRPGELGDELEVVAEDLRFHRLAGETLELLPLPIDLLADLLGEDESVELLLKSLQLVVPILPLAELLLDRLQLLAEEHLPLAVAELLLDLRLDFLLRVEDVDLALDVNESPPHAVFDRERLEEELPVCRRDVDVARDEVGELPGVVRLGQDVRDRLVGEAELLGQLRGALLQLFQECDEGGVGDVERRHFGGLHDDRLEVPVLLLDPHGDATDLPLEEQAGAADSALDRPDGCDGPDGMEQLGCDGLDVLALRQREDELLGALHRRLDGVKRARAAGGDREADSRKKNGVPKGNNRESLGRLHDDLSSRPNAEDSTSDFSGKHLDFQDPRRS